VPPKFPSKIGAPRAQASSRPTPPHAPSPHIMHCVELNLLSKLLSFLQSVVALGSSFPCMTLMWYGRGFGSPCLLTLSLSRRPHTLSLGKSRGPEQPCVQGADRRFSHGTSPQTAQRRGAPFALLTPPFLSRLPCRSSHDTT
jgi:hypothetical protein